MPGLELHVLEHLAQDEEGSERQMWHPSLVTVNKKMCVTLMHKVHKWDNTQRATFMMCFVHRSLISNGPNRWKKNFGGLPASELPPTLNKKWNLWLGPSFPGGNLCPGAVRHYKCRGNNDKRISVSNAFFFFNFYKCEGECEHLTLSTWCRSEACTHRTRLLCRSAVGTSQTVCAVGRANSVPLLSS